MIDLTGNFPNNSLAAVLNTGLNVIDQNQVVMFNTYKRVILPYDGYVFWVLETNVAPIQVSGSLHYATDQRQEVDKTIAYQNVVFTTPTEVADFNDLQPDQLLVGQWDDFEFSFSSHANRYEQAGLWHYFGQAVYPEMRTQIIQSVSDLPASPIVSNSLPIWISLNAYGQVYPSYLVPENLTPPYIVCDIQADDTSMLQPIAWEDGDNTWQLMRDHVRFITYGLLNRDIQNFVQYLQNQSMSGLFGIMQMGITVKDGKRIQSELNVLAQQKIIELDVSYNQSAVYDSIDQIISTCLPPTVQINPD